MNCLTHGKSWKRGGRPFQSYKINSQVFKRRLLYTARSRSRMVYAEVKDESGTILIIPLIKNRNGTLYSLSNVNGLKNYDIIFDTSQEPLKVVKGIDFFFDSVSNRVELDDVTQMSPLIKWTEHSDHDVVIEKIEQIRIPYQSSYEDYISGLSKSAKQNIRTAYNRMNNDNRNYSFKCYFGEPIPPDKQQKILNVCCKRRSEKYHNASVLHSFYLKYLDWITEECQTNHFAFNAVLEIDGEVAAFMSGFENRFEDEISIPRLAIDATFSRYSPGIILLNETAKVLTETQRTKFFDLYGATAPYKKQMGGQLYYKYRIIKEVK